MAQTRHYARELLEKQLKATDSRWRRSLDFTSKEELGGGGISEFDRWPHLSLIALRQSVLEKDDKKDISLRGRSVSRESFFPQEA